jgi:hypothetical protein
MKYTMRIKLKMKVKIMKKKYFQKMNIQNYVIKYLNYGIKTILKD